MIEYIYQNPKENLSYIGKIKRTIAKGGRRISYEQTPYILLNHHIPFHPVRIDDTFKMGLAGFS